jgi:hypothetical protein
MSRATVVRFNGELVDRDALSRLLDFVELESIRKRSQLGKEDAAQLADEIDRSVWERIKHKEKIVRLSRLGDEDVVHLFYELLRELELYKEELVAPANRAKAAELCQDVDLTDAPRVSIALETGGPSGQATWGKPNQKLKQGLRAKGFARFFEPPR